MVKINWHSFLEFAREKIPKEACGFVFAENMYTEGEIWHVMILTNISEDPENSWLVDSKEVAKIKKLAIQNKWIKIGNVHSHPLTVEGYDEDLLKPSELDLKFARKFRDIARAVVVCGKNKIYGIRWHDMFGKELKIGEQNDK